MANFYSGLILRYVYGETNEALTAGIKRLLKRNAELRELYFRLKESKQRLNKNLHLKRPGKSLIDNILKYGAS